MASSVSTHRMLRTFATLTLALLALVACQREAAAPPPTPLRFGMDLWPGYFPAVIAERRGLMAKRGVALEVLPTSDTSTLIAEFAAGRHDLIAVSLGDAITLSRTRPDVIVLLVADESAGGDQVLRSPKAPADLRHATAPLRLGTNLGGFGEVFLRAWLEREGIPPQTVVWSNVDASDVPSALAEGRIDIGHTWQPYADDARTLGATTVFCSRDTPGLILDVVLTTREVLAAKPDALRGFATAWFEAGDVWAAAPEEGNRLAAEGLGLAPESISLEGVKPYTLADNQRVMAGGGGAPLASLIHRYAEFFVERGRLSRPPEAAALFDPALLPAPAAVTR